MSSWRTGAGWALAGVAALVLCQPTATVTVTQQAEGAARCTGAEYRQFDFWIGDWEVTGPGGEVVGTNRIERIVDGCALSERWTGRAGSVGHSVNMFDRSTRTWHQTWVDNSGLLLQLDGGLQGEAMVLSGTTRADDGAVTRQRISWEPSSDGTVRQHWETSTDDGRSWTTVFDGIYAKTAP